MQYIVTAASKRVQPGEPDTSRKAPAGKAALAPVASGAKKIDAAFVQPAQTSVLSSAMKIIAQESGLAPEDITDESCLPDIGIDSLLCMVISSRFRDELGIDLQSTAMMEFDTIESMKTFLKRLDSTQTLVEVVTTTEDTTAFAPLQEEPSDSSTLWNSALKIIAEESGVALEDLTCGTDFSDIGVDSLLSLVICSRFRDELILELNESLLFVDFPTINDLKLRILGGSQSINSTPDSRSTKSSSSLSSLTNKTETSATSVSEALDRNEHEKKHNLFENPRKKANGNTSSSNQATSIKPAWSIILQGVPRRAEKILFLFPDGSGAATSYVKLPSISPSTAVIGFNSPFMRYVKGRCFWLTRDTCRLTYV